ncbi:MAG: hypothetical protein FJY65_03510, partial [Calditrichaeota bacterium]|nr:hypothetical protein [Calditrichota bacterium]
MYIIVLIFLIPLTIFAQPRLEWWQIYRNGRTTLFSDIFRAADGSYSAVGSSSNEYISFYFVKTTPQGAAQFQQIYDQRDIRTLRAFTVIQTDDGGYALGGESSPTRACCIKTDADGEVNWIRLLGEENLTSSFSAVIELKSGELLFAGGHNRDGYLVLIQQNGDVQWERSYGEADPSETFKAMREVEDEGIVLGGNRTPRNGNSSFWFIKVDFDGDVIWERIYPLDNGVSETLNDMTSCNGGFALAGNRGHWMRNEPVDFLLKRVDRNGFLIWSNTYSLNDNSPEQCYGIKKMPDDGFILCGLATLNGPGALLRTNAGGEELWRRADIIEGARTGYYSIVVDNQGGITACGGLYSDDNQELNNVALITKTLPEHNAPRIFWRYPDQPHIDILTGDSIRFGAAASDPDLDTLNVQWILNQDLLSTTWMESNDTSWIWISSDTITLDSLYCIVSDGNLTTSVNWLISFKDFFIVSSTPANTGTSIRRNTVVSFSIDSIAYIDDGRGRPAYRWSLIDRLDDDRREEV